jgi:hypothetical protein
MFTNISWSTYFSYVALSCGLWYAFVAIRFYHAEIRMIFLKKALSPAGQDAPVPPFADNVQPIAVSTHPDEPDALISRIEALSSKLEDAVKESAEKGYSKEEFMFLLQLTIKEFPELNIPKCRTAIKSLVISECEKFSFLVLTDQELETLWKDIAREQ